jgi:serine/threonine-protein kinase
VESQGSSPGSVTSLDQIAADPVLRERGLVVEDVLGEGGSSTVYRARDSRHGRDVAVKVVKQDPALGRASERFEREVRVAARLRHAHILPLYDSGVLSDGRVFAVMPVARGRPLRAMMDEGPLTVADAVRIAREVGEALEYLHESGYTHRDVKPENILVESGHAVVTDFGLSTPLGEIGDGRKGRSSDWWTQSIDGTRLTDAGGAVGTLAYMSPEALSGDDVDERSDIYSLGCVLYEMLAGDLPPIGLSANELLARRLRDGLPSLRKLRSDVPEQLDEIVARCTSPAPEDRFARAKVVVEALGAVPVVAAGSTIWIRARERGWALVGTVGLLLALGGGVLLWHQVRKSTELDPQRIVVADLANDTGDPAFDRVGVLAGDIIAGALADSTRLSVVNAIVPLPSRQQRSLPVADSVLSRQTRDLVVSTRAGVVVTGAYFRTGAALEIVAEVIDSRSGRVLGLAGPVRTRADRPDSALRGLASRVVEVVRRRHFPPD